MKKENEIQGLKDKLIALLFRTALSFTFGCITIDARLTWCKHAEEICKKIASAIGALKRVQPLISNCNPQLL